MIMRTVAAKEMCGQKKYLVIIRLRKLCRVQLDSDMSNLKWVTFPRRKLDYHGLIICLSGHISKKMT